MELEGTDVVATPQTPTPMREDLAPTPAAVRLLPTRAVHRTLMHPTKAAHLHGMSHRGRRIPMPMVEKHRHGMQALAHRTLMQTVERHQHGMPVRGRQTLMRVVEVLRVVGVVQHPGGMLPLPEDHRGEVRRLEGRILGGEQMMGGRHLGTLDGLQSQHLG